MLQVLCFFAVYVAGVVGAPQPIPVAGTYYTNFNLLSNVPRAYIQWAQGKTVPGWWTNQGHYRVASGELSNPGLYSLGVEDSTERSLGGIVSHHDKVVLWGLSLKNEMTHSVSSATFVVVGEQWRYGGTPDSQTYISVEYSIMSQNRYDKRGGWGVDGSHTRDWIYIHELNVTSSVDSGSGPIAINGNENQKTLKATIEFDRPWKKDKILQVRFVMGKADVGASNCLAIRSLLVDPTPKAPEHASLAWIGWLFVTLGLLVVVVAGFFAVWRKYGNVFKHHYIEGYTFLADEEETSKDSDKTRLKINHHGDPRGYDVISTEYTEEEEDDEERGREDERFGTGVPGQYTLFDAFRRTISAEGEGARDSRSDDDGDNFIGDGEGEGNKYESAVIHTPDPNGTCLLCGQDQRQT